jgi:hypothetical protein
MNWQAEDANTRVLSLIPIAFANGDKALQRGWWPYVSVELDKLEQVAPGIKARFIEKLKTMP